MVDLAGWVSRLDAVVGLIGSRFVRSEPRARVGAYVRGLLAGLERKNGWTLAEHAGAVSPDGMQRLLRTADWDVDGVRDDVRGYVLDGLGRPRPDGDSGLGCSSPTTPGSSRRAAARPGCSGSTPAPAGRSTTVSWGCSWPTPRRRGHALIDRELYLPASWTEDRDRCTAAGIPEETEFATKPELVVRMLERVHAAGRLSGWFTADEAFGQNPGLRDWLADHRVPYVLATRNDDLLTCPDGHRERRRCWPPSPASTPPAGSTRPRGSGAAWATARTANGSTTGPRSRWTRPGCPTGWGHWLLVRQQVEPTQTEGKTTPERAYYRCAGPARTPLRELIRVAGTRWAIEECFQTAKNEAGLDHYQVRTWRAWYAHITLAMLAAGWLAVTRAHEHQADQAEKGDLGSAVTTITKATATS